MNKLVQEIAGQSLDQAVPETWSCLTNEQLQKFQERFAENMALECAKYIVSTNVEKVEDAENLERIRSDYVHLARDILKHFGVE